MRVLFVTPYLPLPADFGGARRIDGLLKEMSRRHEVTVLSLAGPDDDPRPSERAYGRVVPVPVPFTARMPAGTHKRRAQLRALPSRHSFQHHMYWRTALQRELDRLTSEGVDLVQFEFSQMGVYRVPSSIPTVLDVHNLEYDLLRQLASGGPLVKRLFNMIEYRKFRREEPAIWRRMSTCLTTSEQDAQIVRREVSGDVEVVPNGVDLTEFARLPDDLAEPASLVFVGAMRYQPNADAAQYFVDQIWPLIQDDLPDARLTIVGADPPASVEALARGTEIEVTGTVPDIRPWLARAGIVVVPLLTGGGTRLKILEAFAAGRPVVSTSVGASGLEARHGEHLLLADEPAEFAQAIVRLATDPAMRRALSDRAHELVLRDYSWSAIVERLDAVYHRLAGQPLSPPQSKPAMNPRSPIIDRR